MRIFPLSGDPPPLPTPPTETRPMRRLTAAVLMLMLAACDRRRDCAGEGCADAAGDTTATLVVPPPHAEAAAALRDSAPPGQGQLVYVPVYSHIYFRNQRKQIPLAATLSVRNTDPERPITVAFVHYYNTEGYRVRSYLPRPTELSPMASLEFVVEDTDTAGAGANFLVEWRAREPVTEPVIEAVMISTASSLGISFTSVGRPLSRRR